MLVWYLVSQEFLEIIKHHIIWAFLGNLTFLPVLHEDTNMLFLIQFFKSYFTQMMLVDWGLTSHQQLRSYGEDLSLESHPTDWRSPGSNLCPLVYKASDITTLAKKSRLFYSFCAALKALRKLRKSRRYWHLRICCRKASFSAELRKSRVYAGILTKL